MALKLHFGESVPPPVLISATRNTSGHDGRCPTRNRGDDEYTLGQVSHGIREPAFRIVRDRVDRVDSRSHCMLARSGSIVAGGAPPRQCHNSGEREHRTATQKGAFRHRALDSTLKQLVGRWYSNKAIYSRLLLRPCIIWLRSLLPALACFCNQLCCAVACSKNTLICLKSSPCPRTQM